MSELVAWGGPVMQPKYRIRPVAVTKLASPMYRAEPEAPSQ